MHRAVQMDQDLEFVCNMTYQRGSVFFRVFCPHEVILLQTPAPEVPYYRVASLGRGFHSFVCGVVYLLINLLGVHPMGNCNQG